MKSNRYVRKGSEKGQKESPNTKGHMGNTSKGMKRRFKYLYNEMAYPICGGGGVRIGVGDCKGWKQT